MNQVTAIISMLHEEAKSNSATRLFRKQTVLDWTLTRLARAGSTDSVALVYWEDQQLAVLPVVERHAGVLSFNRGLRQNLVGMQAITAARRWADGWRGGLLGTCELDLGFHPQWVADIAKALDADGVLLIDPAAALIDPVLVNQLIEHAQTHPAAEFCFSQAAPGLCGTLLRRELVDRLAIAKIHPGRLLTYWPDQHGLDPATKEGSAPVPVTVARSLHRFKIDTFRQITRTNYATIALNGHLISTESEVLVQRMGGCESVDPLPRDVILELTTRRGSNPVYGPGKTIRFDRPDASMSMISELFTELGKLDDVRVTFAGVGDPLCFAKLFEVIKLAKTSGISAVHLETDLLDIDAAAIRQLAQSDIDIVTVHCPAATAETYLQVMGVNRFAQMMENIRLLEAEVKHFNRGTPLIVPTFTKTTLNLAEMEPWYDYWIRRLGHAVINGPSDFAGQIPDTAVADMAPPRRKPCARLRSRLSILSDGRVVSCEQDILGKQTMGNVGESPINEIWQQRFASLRSCHEKSDWDRQPLCGSCREWHRS